MSGRERVCPNCGGTGEVRWDYNDPTVEAVVEAVEPCPCMFDACRHCGERVHIPHLKNHKCPERSAP